MLTLHLFSTGKPVTSTVYRGKTFELAFLAQGFCVQEGLPDITGFGEMHVHRAKEPFEEPN